MPPVNLAKNKYTSTVSGGNGKCLSKCKAEGLVASDTSMRCYETSCSTGYVLLKNNDHFCNESCNYSTHYLYKSIKGVWYCTESCPDLSTNELKLYNNPSVRRCTADCDVELTGNDTDCGEIVCQANERFYSEVQGTGDNYAYKCGAVCGEEFV